MPDAGAFLRKAEESLASAQADQAGRRHNACIRNSYFAAFQSAVAALIAEGILPRNRWEHSFVQARFSGVLIRQRKRYPSVHRSTLRLVLEMRNGADYTEVSVSRRDATRIMEMCGALVGAVKERVDDSR